MATYTVDPIGTQYPDPILQAAKQFMGSPDYSRRFMDNVQSALAPQRSLTPLGRPPETPLAMSDLDLLAGALTAEGVGLEDQMYIASVINNRVNSPRFPSTLRDVIMQPGQFSAFNTVTGYAGGEGGNNLWKLPTPQAREIAFSFLTGGHPDMTRGALNYFNPDLANPKWGQEGFYSLPGSTHLFGIAR